MDIWGQILTFNIQPNSKAEIEKAKNSTSTAVVPGK